MAKDPQYIAYKARLARILAQYVLGLCIVLAGLAWAEQSGLSRQWLGPIFLFSTVMIYAAIGIYGRTTDADEYYVAGRRIPPFYNGMAAAADWMSAASFISMAGGLYLQGFGGAEGQAGGLAYVLGWTGGFYIQEMDLRSVGPGEAGDTEAVRAGGWVGIDVQRWVVHEPSR